MLCETCGINEVKTGNNFCLICFFSGRMFEGFLLDDERSNLLGRIRQIPNVTQAAVWHDGQGMFQLGVILKDGRVVAPGFAIATQNGLAVLPGIPPMLDRWAVSIIDEKQKGVTVLADSYSDDELVGVVAMIADDTLPLEAEQIVI